MRLGGHDLHGDPLHAKALCGFVPDRPHVYEKLTGAEFLDFVADLYQVDPAAKAARRERLLELFDLDEWRDELAESYSHGMKQRLVMAAALVHAPRILIVDEPTVGMDPRGARLLKRIFRELARDGVTVFMSTHSLEVAEELCDRIGIILRGRLIALGTVDELREQAGRARRRDAGERLPAPDRRRGRRRVGDGAAGLSDGERQPHAGRSTSAPHRSAPSPRRRRVRARCAALLAPRLRAARNRYRHLGRAAAPGSAAFCVLALGFGAPSSSSSTAP